MPPVIVGMSARLPGASDLETLWNVMVAGDCVVRDQPEGRWLAGRFFHPDHNASGYSYSFAGGYIDDPLSFDPMAFGISPREAAQIDPQQRLLLELVWEALEDAGIPPSSVAGKRVGVYVGASNVDYQSSVSIDQATMESHFITGISLAIASNRISYIFDWKGPSLTIDTACSSSIVALDHAVAALEAGVIDTAVVAGVNMLLSPIPFIGFSRARMLSPTGRCRPFSAGADGYVRAEGGVALVLRTPAAARAAHNRVRASIVATGVNSDGRTVGVSLPSVKGQASLLRSVYEKAGVTPDQLAFVEAHGTGTPVGDPIEARAIGLALGQLRTSPLIIGSIKSNIGHLESASGVASIVKTVLALERRRYPRSALSSGPSPHIPFEELNLRLASDNTELEQYGIHYAGVCNYGFGGTNAHALLRSAAPDERAGWPEAGISKVEPQALVISAHTRDALAGMADAWSDRLSWPDADVAELARSAAAHRDLLAHRMIVPIGDRAAMVNKLAAAAEGAALPDVVIDEALPSSQVALVFSGNGCQWPGMGLAALRNASFAQEMGHIDSFFAPIAGWSLVEALHAADLKTRLVNTSVAQPLIYAIQSALYAVLRSHGVAPAYVLGHSVGEIAAAEAVGAISRAEAVRLVIERSKAQELVRGLGGMLAVSTDADILSSLLQDYDQLDVAASNSPSSFTLSGPKDALAAFEAAARHLRMATVRLALDYPFHSRLLDSARTSLIDHLGWLRPKEANIPFISTVSGAVMDGTALDSEYWWRNVRDEVRFGHAVSVAIESGANLFVEISPRAILTRAISATCRELGGNVRVLASLGDHDETVPDRDPVLALVSRLAACGGAPVGDMLAGSPPDKHLQLPHYPWRKQLCILPKTLEGIESFGRIDGGERHPLLGTRLAHESPEWRMLLDERVTPYLADHKVGGEVVVPGAAFVEIALAAARELYGAVPLELLEVDIFRPLTIAEGEMREISTRFERSRSRVEIWTRLRFASEWVLSAAGQILCAHGDPSPPAGGPDADKAQCLAGDAVYDAADAAGLNYGPAFRRVTSMRTDDRWLDVDIVDRKTPCGAITQSQVLDPTVLDSAFHGLFKGMRQKPGETRAFLPVRIRRLVFWRHGERPTRAIIEQTRQTPRARTLRGWLLSDTGETIAEFDSVYLRAAVLGRVDHAGRAFSSRFEPLRDPKAAERTVVSARISPLGVDDDWLLARAAIISSAQEALVAIAGPDAILDVEAAIARGAISAAARSVLSPTLSLLADVGVADSRDDNWLIESRRMFPPATALLAAMTRRDPAAQAELLLANAVVTRLAMYLRDGPSAGDTALTKLFWSTSSVATNAAKAVIAELRPFIGMPPPRVLLLEPAAPAISAPLYDLARRGEIVLISAGSRATGAGAQLAPGQGRHVDLLGKDWAQPSAIAVCDLMVVMLTGDLPDRTERTRIASMLAPEAVAIVAPPLQDAALDLCLALISPDNAAPARNIALDSLLSELGFSKLQAADAPSIQLVRRLSVAQSNGTTAVHRSAVALEISGGSEQPLTQALASLAGDGPCLRLDLPDGDAPDNDPQSRALRIAARLRAMTEAGETGQFWIVVHNAFALDASAAPTADALWSFGRVAMNEHPDVDLRLISLNSSGSDAADASRLLAAMSEAGAERELILTPSGLQGVRITPAIMGPERVRKDSERTSMAVEPGASFDGIRWDLEPRRAPGDGEIEIAVEAVGLNFRDVMVGMGLLDENLLAGGMSGAAIGFECAGRVVACGRGVTFLREGECVMGFAANAFASHLTAPAQGFVAVPGEISLTAAATIPVAFSTAWFALAHVARVRAGDLVLIHGAVGGVGLAALQIARHLGARIIATAGSPERRALAEALGAEATYDSRSPDFADVIRKRHGGVDVVLNSLAGEAMQASLRLLRPFGRFIELGKRDYLDNSAVALRPFLHNLTYAGVDLDELLASDPTRARQIMTEISELFATGVFSPLPHRTFDSAHVGDALRLMQRSGHVGKIVVQPAERGRERDVETLFSPGAGAFLVVGGTRGFGLETALWLLRRGAERVVVASRTGALSDIDQTRVARFGAQFLVEQVDAADPAAVTALVERVRANHGPIAGVVHTAMVLEDGLLDGLTAESLDRVTGPKIRGLQALDAATRQDTLQCFVAYSSATTLVGNPGQGAYVLANAFMEGVMRARRLAGLPALAIGWGAISDVGVVARTAGLGDRIARATGVRGVTSRDALEWLGILLAQGEAVDPVQIYSAMGHSAVSERIAVLTSPAFASMRSSGEAQEAGDSLDLAAIVAGKSVVEALKLVTDLVRNEIARILRVDTGVVDPHKPLGEIGMDSLMGLELRLNVEKHLSVELPLMSLGNRTPVHLAETILSRITAADEQVDHAAQATRDLKRTMAIAHGADAHRLDSIVNSTEATALAALTEGSMQ